LAQYFGKYGASGFRLNLGLNPRVLAKMLS